MYVLLQERHAASDVATDSMGNSYTTGSYIGTVDFDPANEHVGNTDIRSSSEGGSDIFVAKRSPMGDLLWVSTMSGSSASSGGGKAITTDTNGNVFVGGSFFGTINFGGTALSSAPSSVAGSYDAFAAKLSPDGSVLWANRWGGGDRETVNSIAVDTSGNALTAGFSASEKNGDVRKFNSDGASVWALQLVSNASGSAEGISSDSSGNVYVAGSFSGTMDFDSGVSTRNVTTVSPYLNGFVLKLTPSGSYTWVSAFLTESSTASTLASDIEVEASGNIVVGGNYIGKVDFKPGNGTYNLPYSGSSRFGFIEKLSSSGTLVWASQVGSHVQSLALDNFGNILVAGELYGSADFDPSARKAILTSNGGNDVFIAKYSKTGNFTWAMSFGGTGMERVGGIDVDPFGNLYVCGYYNNTVDFDPNPLSDKLRTSAGLQDMFLLKLKNLL